MENLPDHVTNAFVAAEDPGFWAARPLPTIRIIFDLATAPLRTKPVVTRAGIPAQVARWKFSVDNPGVQGRSLSWQLNWVVQTDLIEIALSNQQILELYLTHIYIDKDARGFECAANRQFAKPLRELTLAEAAQLAARAKSPSFYEKHPDRMLAQRNKVLTAMAENGFISWDEMRAADAQPLTVPSNPADRSRPSGP